tara:strand:+ start:149 stop:760 length:612 start_codon:yes stop_codon:yes gene_type:complete
MQDFGLVIIGAHSGVFLKKLIAEYTNQKTLLVEPVPYNYEVLEKEYKNYPNILTCRNAILDEVKKDNFYYVKKDSISKLGKHWASQIGSFDKNHILNHKNKRFNIQNEDIQITEVEFITFNDLVKKYLIKSIDKLQIDVEGAEYKIMNSINYKEIKINNIVFESKHFDGTFTEGKKLNEIKNKLISNGYTLKQVDKENILATK